jgi:hypothetical protein
MAIVVARIDIELGYAASLEIVNKGFKPGKHPDGSSSSG